jgi:prepilin-type processing-associated H-X9-DG protein
MKTRFSNHHLEPGEKRPAFTIVELLVIIAVVALLVLLQIPALARASQRTRTAQCAGNLRQFALVEQIYARENRDQLPAVSGSNWAWDVPINTMDSITRFGSSRNSLYCPANPEQNGDGLWNYQNMYRIIGYVTTLPGLAISATNWNSSVTPQSIPNGPISFPPPPASQRVLVADVVMTSLGQTDPALVNTYQYTGFQGGYNPPGWQGHRTSHMNARIPSGGNVAMLDGHVEWRPFASMLPRVPGASPTPVFWW